MRTAALTIGHRFRGPPRSGNGGYVCGSLARHLDGPACVRLEAPPPLETPLTLEIDDAEVRLRDGDTRIAVARWGAPSVEAPPAPGLPAAADASRGYLGFTEHHFPGCFVCGPDRAPGDGLRIFPGAVEGRPLVAAPWTPDASLAPPGAALPPEYVWAALDCTGAFAILPLPDERTIVLGELCAELRAPVIGGAPYVAAGWPLGRDRRKHLAGSALYAAGGAVVAVARAVWIEVALRDFA